MVWVVYSVALDNVFDSLNLPSPLSIWLAPGIEQVLNLWNWVGQQ